MADGFRRFRAPFTVQASAAIAAGADSTGTKTSFDTADVNKLNGAWEAEIEVDVTAFTANARCEIYEEPEQHDGTGNMAPRKLQTLSITGVGKYKAQVNDLSEDGFIFIKALDTGFTASVSMRGIYPSDA